MVFSPTEWTMDWIGLDFENGPTDISDVKYSTYVNCNIKIITHHNNLQIGYKKKSTI